MKFDTPRKTQQFEIPDAWWNFVSSERFELAPGGYYPYRPREGVILLKLADIAPPARNPEVETFRRYKLIPVLLAFQSPECCVPPIEVQHLHGDAYSYRVFNGFHRYYASIAVGYQRIAAAVVEDSSGAL